MFGWRELKRPWYSLGYLSHGTPSGGSVLVGGAGRTSMNFGGSLLGGELVTPAFFGEGLHPQFYGVLLRPCWDYITTPCIWWFGFRISAGHLCMAGYGLGTVASVNPLADALQLSTRLLLEEPWLCNALGFVGGSTSWLELTETL